MQKNTPQVLQEKKSSTDGLDRVAREEEEKGEKPACTLRLRTLVLDNENVCRRLDRKGAMATP
jgi:hypothetical protein